MGASTTRGRPDNVVASACDERRARGEIIGVDKIEDMRGRAWCGKPITSITRAVGVSGPMTRNDLSPEPPRGKSESKILAPYEGTIGSSATHPQVRA